MVLMYHKHTLSLYVSFTFSDKHSPSHKGGSGNSSVSNSPGDERDNVAAFQTANDVCCSVCKSIHPLQHLQNDSAIWRGRLPFPQWFLESKQTWATLAYCHSNTDIHA